MDDVEQQTAFVPEAFMKYNKDRRRRVARKLKKQHTSQRNHLDNAKK